ncbi:hypothetical protein VCHC55B2_3271A, partial [Vibrio cholerae HC-55B2]
MSKAKKAHKLLKLLRC